MSESLYAKFRAAFAPTHIHSDISGQNSREKFTLGGY
jgi:hypothetical protein